MENKTVNIEKWLYEVDKIRSAYWNKNFNYKPYTPLKYKKGRKFIKIISENSVWGFVAMADGHIGGAPYKMGDLMKPASWKAPAKHGRGNILDGSAKWGFYGPAYL
tara:strand:+ start:113 stop:430 length:318 start_codon:yes stop_codon:yes gene_type:complete